MSNKYTRREVLEQGLKGAGLVAAGSFLGKPAEAKEDCREADRWLLGSNDGEVEVELGDQEYDISLEQIDNGVAKIHSSYITEAEENEEVFDIKDEEVYLDEAINKEQRNDGKGIAELENLGYEINLEENGESFTAKNDIQGTEMEEYWEAEKVRSDDSSATFDVTEKEYNEKGEVIAENGDEALVLEGVYNNGDGAAELVKYDCSDLEYEHT